MRGDFQLCLPEDRLGIPFNPDTTSTVLQAGIVGLHNTNIDTDREIAKKIRCFTTAGTPHTRSLTLTAHQL